MNDEVTELAPGSRFGNYEIVRMLGQGAFGAVYEALRLPLRKRTALKLLHREHVRQRAVVDRFVREAEVVAQLEHPHIVGVFDVGVEDGVPFIAMEFLDGESLSSRLERRGFMAVEPGVDLMLGVLSAVATVHEKGIVHRDLKPDNILLARLATGGEQPKLLDFGIAKVRDADKALTRTNAVMGTPYYMSPEQAAESKHITAQADQWSLGVILYEVLTGAKPFDGDSLLTLMNSICFGEPRSPVEVKVDLPAPLAGVILKVLSKKPEARYSSVRELGRALLPFASAAARARWEEFFNAAPAELPLSSPSLPPPPPSMRPGDEHASADAALSGTLASPLPMAPTGNASTRVIGAPLPPPGPGRTLDPLTSASPPPAAPARRTAPGLFAVAALALVAVGVGGFMVTREGTPSAASTVTAPPRATSPATVPPPPPVTPVPAPAAPTTEAIPAQPAPTVGGDAAVVGLATDAATPAASAEGDEEGSRRRHRRRHRRDGDDPSRCPNGICPPI